MTNEEILSKPVETLLNMGFHITQRNAGYDGVTVMYHKDDMLSCCLSVVDGEPRACFKFVLEIHSVAFTPTAENIESEHKNLLKYVECAKLAEDLIENLKKIKSK